MKVDRGHASGIGSERRACNSQLHGPEDIAHWAMTKAFTIISDCGSITYTVHFGELAS